MAVASLHHHAVTQRLEEASNTSPLATTALPSMVRLVGFLPTAHCRVCPRCARGMLVAFQEFADVIKTSCRAFYEARQAEGTANVSWSGVPT